MTFDGHEIDKLMTWARDHAPCPHGEPSAAFCWTHRRVRLEIAMEPFPALCKHEHECECGWKVVARAFLAEPRCYHGVNKVDARYLMPCECGPLAEQRLV